MLLKVAPSTNTPQTKSKIVLQKQLIKCFLKDLFLDFVEDEPLFVLHTLGICQTDLQTHHIPCTVLLCKLHIRLLLLFHYDIYILPFFQNSSFRHFPRKKLIVRSGACLWDFAVPLPDCANVIVAELPETDMAQRIARQAACDLQGYRGEQWYAFLPAGSGKTLQSE